MMHLARALGINTQLRNLSVADNMIESPGIQHFSAALRKTGSCPLDRLDLRWVGRAAGEHCMIAHIEFAESGFGRSLERTRDMTWTLQVPGEFGARASLRVVPPTIMIDPHAGVWGVQVEPFGRRCGTVTGHRPEA